MQDTTAYKILLPPEWAHLKQTGIFHGAPNDRADGFIHLSTAAQLAQTVNRHFANIDDLYIAAIDLKPLAGHLKWEPSSGGQLYPHLYAPLRINSVIASFPLEREPDGTIRLPAFPPR